MSDIDDLLHRSCAGWQDAVDTGARPIGSATGGHEPSHRRRRFVGGVLLAALVVVAVAVTAGVVRSRTRSAAMRSSPVSALVGVTWTDPATGGTVVFTATTARVSDGCYDGLRGLTIGAHTLDVGKSIGMQSVCSGTPRPDAGPQRDAYDRRQAAVAKFDRVLSGRSTWSRSGSTLRITTTAGSIALHASR